MAACNILSNHIVSQEDVHLLTHSSSIQQIFRCKTESNFGSQETEAKHSYSLHTPMIQI